MKKIKILLAVLSAMVMLVGGCLTVCAATTNLEYTPNSNGYDSIKDMVTDLSKVYPYVVVTDNNVICGSTEQFLYNSSAQYGQWHFVDSAYVFKGRYVLSNGRFYYQSYDCDRNRVNYGYDGVITHDILYSTHDILWEKDTSKIFFPETVVPIAEMAIELPETIATQIKVILTIAVACLALLATLSVLRKKLPIFLKR